MTVSSSGGAAWHVTDARLCAGSNSQVQDNVLQCVQDIIDEAAKTDGPIGTLLLECTELPHYSDAYGHAFSDIGSIPAIADGMPSSRGYRRAGTKKEPPRQGLSKRCRGT